MIAIIDYGMGNLRSVQKAFEFINAPAVITSVPRDIEQADKVVLPGVGAMRPAMDKLRRLDLVGPILRAIGEGKPFLGICLGMQLLFEQSSEGGETEGLKVIKGRVERFSVGKVPHMGWNQIDIKSAGRRLGEGLASGENMYFCHSYFVRPQDPYVAAATTFYGVEFVSAVVAQNVWGVQFHPEKSQKAGLKVLENFKKL